MTSTARATRAAAALLLAAVSAALLTPAASAGAAAPSGGRECFKGSDSSSLVVKGMSCKAAENLLPYFIEIAYSEGTGSFGYRGFKCRHPNKNPDKFVCVDRSPTTRSFAYTRS